MRWTDEQDDVLMAHAHLGPEGCCEALARETGAVRSPQSVQRRASRLGASMARLEECPRCGQLRPRLNRTTGLCETCHMSLLADRQEAVRDQLARKLEALKGGGDEEFERERKRYDSNRQANKRLRERIRKCEDSVKLSKSLSNASSEVTKSFREGNETCQTS